MRDCEGYSTERLHAERSRLKDCLSRSCDTFSNMLLMGQIGMIDREIEKRADIAAAESALIQAGERISLNDLKRKLSN